MLSSQLLGRDVVRWGIIGCGDVTEVKSGPGFQRATGSKLVAVMRRNGALAADYARRHGVPRSYDDAVPLISDPEVDAVYVATPPDTHAHYALLALAAGKPVYVEKPMARHTPECDAMLEASRAAGQKLFVAYYRRALPRFLAVAETLSHGVIGRVTSVTWTFRKPGHRAAKGAWRVRADVAGGGEFLDLAAHALDLIDFLLGPLRGVAGTAARRASESLVEDAVAMSFQTASGVPGALTCNFASAIAEDRLELTGTEGRLALSMFGAEPLSCETDRGVELIERPHPAHVAQPLIQTIVDDLLGRGTCPSTGETARRTSRVMDVVLAGYYCGRDDAFWTRPETWTTRTADS